MKNFSLNKEILHLNESKGGFHELKPLMHLILVFLF